VRGRFEPRVLLLGVAVAVVFFLLVSAFIQSRRAAGYQDERAQVQLQIDALQRELANTPTQGTARAATAPDDVREEAAFLTFLRTAASASGAQITRWMAQARPAPPAPDKVDAATKDVTPLTGNLEVVGTYKATLNFTNRLITSSRLINLNEVAWTRDQDGRTRLNMLVTRFVEPPAPAPSASEPPKTP